MHSPLSLLVCECFLHHLDFMTATAMDPSDWAMYAPCAYDTLLDKRLESAAASVMWLPETSPCGREGLEEDYEEHSLLVGVQDQILMMRATLLKPGADLDLRTTRDDGAEDTPSFDATSMLEVSLRFAHAGPARGLCYAPAAPSVIASAPGGLERSEPGDVHIFDLDRLGDEEKYGMLTSAAPRWVLRGHSDAGRGVAWRPEAGGAASSAAAALELVTTADDGTACLWNLEARPETQRSRAGTTKPVQTWEDAGGRAGKAVNSVAFDPASPARFATAGDDCRLVLYDVRAPKPAAAAAKAHARAATSVAFTREPNCVATGGSDGVVKLWDARQLKAGPTRAFASHAPGKRAVHVAPAPWGDSWGREALVASCAGDGSVTVTETATADGGVVFLHQFHQAPVNQLAWHPALEWVAASVDEAGCLAIWEPSTWSLDDDDDDAGEARDDDGNPGDDCAEPASKKARVATDEKV